MFEVRPKHCSWHRASLGWDCFPMDRNMFRAFDYLSNLDCAALRAMTRSKGESAVILFGILMQLLELCGAIQNFA